MEEKEVTTRVLVPMKFQLSIRERDLCMFFLKTESYKETAKLLSEKYRKKFHWKTVLIWIDRKPHVKEELGKKFEAKWKWEAFTEGEWGSQLIDGFEGKKDISGEQIAIAKLIGISKGWARENMLNNQSNVQIRFTQSNGEE